MTAPDLTAEVNGLAAAVRERHGSRIAVEITRRYRGDQPGVIRALKAALGIAVEQEARADRDVDRLTILECAMGHRAAKKITPSGGADYAAGKWFATAAVEVDGVARIAAILEDLQGRPRMFVIRGELIEGRSPRAVRKMCHGDKADENAPYFRTKPRRSLAIDLDSFTLPPGVDPLDVRAVAGAARALLPAEFRRASCWAQLTAGAGFKPGGRVRLWFWLSRCVSDAEAKRWLRGSPVDHSLYSPVQPHYVAAPIFEGVVDPVPLRSQTITGEVDIVSVPDLSKSSGPETRKKADHAHQRSSKPTFGGFCAGTLGPQKSRLGGERYMRIVVDGVRRAPVGQGRAALMSAAMRLYGAAKAGRVDPVRATALLKRTMIDRGWSADEDARGMTMADLNRQLTWCWERSEPR